ncbi:hypothetical protein C1H46_036894 [Malus baccata]|uniref:Protein kinase domain-containing protein n=1 Tax=Malus baccata TaxID=106549 RepID=A0A540KTM9_MALBA|nr:hypothetical protein C1H46_036894 [Malus baccata]
MGDRPSKLLIKSVIARGSFGTVHRGIYDGQDVAVKLLDWGEEGHRTDSEIASLRAAFTQEVVVWHKLDHPNVTKFIGATMGSSDLQIPKKILKKKKKKKKKNPKSSVLYLLCLFQSRALVRPQPRFFCLSVYVTMYLNDCQRTAFYQGIGLNTKEFDMHVIIETNRTTARMFFSSARC